MPLLHTLRDDFGDNTVDTALWPDSYDPGGYTETGGRARLTCNTAYNGYASAATYTLAESYLFCRVYPPADDGAASEAWAQVLITSSTPGTDAVFEVNAATGNINMGARTGYFDAGSVTIPYNGVDHAWLRIRETAGVLYWETSRNGAAWTVRRSATSPAWVGDTDIQAQLLAHRDAGTVDFAEFDSVNIEPGYEMAIDWQNDGSFTNPYDNVTDDVLDRGVTVTYGREQGRQLSPGAVGSAGMVLCNASRLYSPERADSPLADDIGPARPVRFQVAHDGTIYPIFTGRIDDFNLRADYADRSATITALDGLSLLQGLDITTEILTAPRTGQIIDRILTAVGWTAPRDLDPGATHARYWWADSEDAFDALQAVVRSEGPPAIAYVAPDGTFVFRDRHHRLLDAVSRTSQATFAQPEFDCDGPPVTGFGYTAPFEYEHGWRDIINSVNLDIADRIANSEPSVVWEYGSPLTIVSGETIELEASASDPFTAAITPVAGTDYTVSGGTLSVSLTRTSGQSTGVRLTAIGAVTVGGLQLRATSLPQSSVTKVTQTDPSSVSAHGERTYQQQVPWVNSADALAVAQLVIAHYATRRPTVKLRVASCDDDHFEQVVTRTISDRITIVNAELGLDAGFFVETVTHTVDRMNPERPPVHAVVLGCERVLQAATTTPFTFDLAAHGFDDGYFGGIGVDDPDTVFIFDDPVQGQFGTGVFGT
ncbi:hypothetical protein GCM10023084_03510 [Streptomyces lacrimifluminis]|uniref:hypothetical protein n=1 Tax=Streptomyces lacrimifluminis TaxID=1500077 RepID=UPI0031E57060